MRRKEDRMIHPPRRGIPARAIAAAVAAATLAGCAHGALFGSRKPAARSKTEVISAPARSGDPLRDLEQELANVRSEKVVVSAALLRSLARNARLQQTECKNISGQLEALKNIDLEETGGSKE